LKSGDARCEGNYKPANWTCCPRPTGPWPVSGTPGPRGLPLLDQSVPERQAGGLFGLPQAGGGPNSVGGRHDGEPEMVQLVLHRLGAPRAAPRHLASLALDLGAPVPAWPVLGPVGLPGGEPRPRPPGLSLVLLVFLVANLAYGSIPSGQDFRIAARSPVGWGMLALCLVYGWTRFRAVAVGLQPSRVTARILTGCRKKLVDLEKALGHSVHREKALMEQMQRVGPLKPQSE